MPLRLLAFLVLLALPLPAFAQDREAARAAFRRGSQHYNLNELDEALAAFKEAYRAYEDPTLLFNIGQCQRRLGRSEEAIATFRAFLRELPDAPNRAEVQQLLEKLVAEVEEAKRHKAEAEARAAAQAAEEAERRQRAAAEAAPTPVVVAAPAERKPLYKKWWLWTAVGGVVAVGVGLGVGLALGLPPGDSFPSLDGANRGTVRF